MYGTTSINSSLLNITVENSNIRLTLRTNATAVSTYAQHPLFPRQVRCSLAMSSKCATRIIFYLLVD